MTTENSGSPAKLTDAVARDLLKLGVARNLDQAIQDVWESAAGLQDEEARQKVANFLKKA